MRPKHMNQAHQVVEMMDPDHFITGEGGRVKGVKYGVDLSYNMEMSLMGTGALCPDQRR